MRSLSLAEALAYAAAHQPDLRAAAARVEAVRTRRDVSQARWYPTLTAAAELVASTTNNSTGSYLAVNGIDNPRVSATAARTAATASFQPYPSSLLGFGARQEVYDFGRISAQSAADALRTDAERLSAAGVKLVIENAVQEAYFAVYAAKAVVRASESAYVRAQAHRDQAKAGVDVGMRRPIELTRAQAVLDRYELERLRARGGVVVAQAVLAAAVGVPDYRLDIAATPPSLAELPSLQAAFETMDRNPELKSVLTLMRAQEQQTRSIAAEMRPNLLVSGAISGNAGGAPPSSGGSAEYHGLLPVVPNWDVALVLSWPIFDQTVRARVRQSKADAQLYRAQAEAVQRRLAASIEEAYTEVVTARDALPVLQRTLDAAIANYNQASARFNVGMSNAIEMADAEDLRTTAEIDLARGTFDVARARAALGRFIAEGM
ncbi:MAG TPA: TolC family protein [Polyangia bacterium]|nr:TolC family protein [Polyangia bacterium]